MIDKALHYVARLFLDQLGAHAVRIHDGGVDVKHPAGNFRVTVERQ